MVASDARREVLGSLIDDAGLFPPASLSMRDAVAAHAAARTGRHRWMLGHFICPAGRLAELLPELARTPRSAAWTLSVLLSPEETDAWPHALLPQVAAMRSFSATASAGIVLVETPLPQDRLTADPKGTVRALIDALDGWPLQDAKRPVRPYVEIPLGGDWRREVPAALEEMRRGGSGEGTWLHPGAKLRCGGATADAFPSPEQVAGFITACRELGVAFKATAGLHHPFRHTDPATGFVQHGFLNLAGAAVLAHALSVDENTIIGIMSDDRPDSFRLGPEEFRWGDLAAGPQEIAVARGELLRSYGSCSFTEPAEDLRAFGILPLEPE